MSVAARWTVALAAVLLAVMTVDGVVWTRRARYGQETARLRASMTTLERKRADAVVAANEQRSALALQLVRAQTAGDGELHLAVSSESSFVALERDGVRLRFMHAEFGPSRRVGVPPDTMRVVAPLGLRTVERIVETADDFELPAWVWLDQRQVVPDTKHGSGWAGPMAIITSGGTVLYAVPDTGPLSDSAYVMPGAVRLSATDLVAMRGVVRPGIRVYFF